MLLYLKGFLYIVYLSFVDDFCYYSRVSISYIGTQQVVSELFHYQSGKSFFLLGLFWGKTLDGKFQVDI